MEDCHAALVWLASAAEELVIDPQRIMIAVRVPGLASPSAVPAGARSGQRNASVPIMLNRCSIPAVQTSDHPHVGHFGWTRDHSRFGWSAMAGDNEGPVSPYCSPALAEDLSGLPANLIFTSARLICSLKNCLNTHGD